MPYFSEDDCKYFLGSSNVTLAHEYPRCKNAHGQVVSDFYYVAVLTGEEWHVRVSPHCVPAKLANQFMAEVHIINKNKLSARKTSNSVRQLRKALKKDYNAKILQSQVEDHMELFKSWQIMSDNNQEETSESDEMSESV